MERTYEDLRNLIVGKFNELFATYKLIDTGARMQYLDKHVKQHSVHYIDSDYKIQVHPNRDTNSVGCINAKSYELVKRNQTLFDELTNNYQELLEMYELPNSSSFVHLWLAQTFDSAEQIYQCMQCNDENNPFDKCVKVIAWNSSRFDIVLLWDSLDCELQIMGAPIDDLNNSKSITVTYNRSHMKLQFYDAENLFGTMTLKI
ncbi:MAG: hypothetical protein EZS28_004683 [Streblomastix strix]|uniref:Uncharacterized protein n=1 Tax=Streblomastix strix TaxID=222440 RepID=A0A5J4WY96_9EUKA|nr:MAG: hypothetical protein EZS28_004683 [Streblomastix strix]